MRRSHACAAAGLVLAAAYWLAADALPRSALSDAVGAGGVPKLLAALLALLSIALLFRPGQPDDAQGSLRSLGVAGLGFVYVAILPFIGYPIGLALLAGGAAYYYGARGRNVLVFAVLAALLLWLVFAKTLGIALP